ncbi:hypothetical protein KNV09_gp087 [Vibrio phage Athena]|nr:hypothetical protein KNU52_gp084 [Vibrio phage Achelous]YP_010102518.1 hypothetical protein KNU58_gp078 [Vibrio phage Brizo]YP_010102705.1 hypothetical protein KNU59_gp084 [Vibrio phage Pontus]YP_010107938.1 hypothetical protein KNV05_gp090 [Vibrio phage River4]YP_010108132.1 hypothetical protein KNV06_gp087 [Vibrio phage AG74]YP_010108517.1 hypothetical protein KNV08_gp089 [Vibrio phage Quinn]YP_010108712.1 hypothetical protein KNV09_gp087 [Vibrio phage Athena]QIG66211.1 hypothetical pro
MAKVLVDESVLWGLINSDLLLQHLENEGVDNWSGYYHPEDLDEQTNKLLKEIKHG